MILVISRVNRKTRLTALLTSTAVPSPLALTKLFPGTRNVSIMVLRIVAKQNGQCFPEELPGPYNSPRGLFNFSEVRLHRGTAAAISPLFRAVPKASNGQLSETLSTHCPQCADASAPLRSLQSGCLRLRSRAT